MTFSITCLLQIHTAADSTWQVLLEWPSSAANFVSPTSYTSAFDMGYDMVAECGMDTILAYDSEESKEEGQPYKIKVNTWHWVCLIDTNSKNGKLVRLGICVH